MDFLKLALFAALKWNENDITFQMLAWNSDCWHSQNWKQCQGAATLYITNCTENTSRDTQPTAIDTGRGVHSR